MCAEMPSHSILLLLEIIKIKEAIRQIPRVHQPGHREKYRGEHEPNNAQTHTHTPFFESELNASAFDSVDEFGERRGEKSEKICGDVLRKLHKTQHDEALAVSSNSRWN